jgi:hypothetical protein
MPFQVACENEFYHSIEWLAKAHVWKSTGNIASAQKSFKQKLLFAFTGNTKGKSEAFA